MKETTKEESRLLKYAKAAALLDVSLNHLRGLIDEGFLESVKVGARGRRVKRAQVEHLADHGVELLTGCISTTATAGVASCLQKPIDS